VADRLVAILPKFRFSVGIEVIVHLNEAFSLVIASGPETKATFPLSTSLLRRSTSAAHASSTSGSTSKLAMSRSINRARSG
jgi:hypothetical protein